MSVIKHKSFLIYHPALTYFVKEYSFIQLPIEEEGREPSAAQLKNLITNAQKYGTKIMFIQKEKSDPLINSNLDTPSF